MKIKPYNTTEIINLFMIDQLVLFYDRSMRTSLHQLSQPRNHYELFYMEQGFLDLMIGGEEFRMEPGKGLLIAPGNSFYVSDRSPDARVEVYGFMSRGDLLLPLCHRLIDFTEDEGTLLDELAEEGAQCFERLSVRRSNMLGCKLRPGVTRGRLQALKNKLEIFFIKLIESRLGSKAPAKRVSVADAVYQYLTEHVADRVTLAQIADALSLSIPYIKREFSKKYGQGIIDCLLEMKIDRAKQLIKETTLNFTQIAEYLSFHSENHFSKTFSMRTGKTPGAYLKEIKNQ